jgi:hypothetical protein
MSKTASLQSLLDTPTARASFTSGLRVHGRRQMERAGYVIAGLIGLAIAPVLFMAGDHAVVVRWSNEILDLVSH